MSTATARLSSAPLRPAHVRATVAVGVACSAVTVARLGVSSWTLLVAAAVFVLVWVSAIDLESRLLPDRIVLPTAAGVLLGCALLKPDDLAEHLIAALAVGALMLLFVALRPSGLGMGDAKLAVLLGALLGRTVLEALILGFCLFALAGLGLVVRDGRSALKRQLPLGPFLAFGAIAALLLSGG